MGSKVKGFVLPRDATSSADVVTFPGFPGVWTPGEAKPVEALGIPLAEARDLVAELNLPLKETQTDALAEGALDRTLGLVSAATGESEQRQTVEAPAETSGETAVAADAAVTTGGSV
jgi:hypothetical protein